MHELLVNCMRNSIYLDMLHSLMPWSSGDILGQEALASDSSTKSVCPQALDPPSTAVDVVHILAGDDVLVEEACAQTAACDHA